MEEKHIYIVRASKISSVKIDETSPFLELVVDGVVTILLFNEVAKAPFNTWKKKLRTRASRIEEAWSHKYDVVLRFYDVQVDNSYDLIRLENEKKFM